MIQHDDLSDRFTVEIDPDSEPTDVVEALVEFALALIRQDEDT